MEVKKILVLMLMLSLFIPQFILAEEGTLVIDASSSSSNEHSVRSDMGAFVNGFQGLFKGDTDAFVEGLVQALPLFGLVIIVFGLGYYLSLITIFRKPENEKFAKIFATGLALLGLAQQKIYDLVLGLSTALLSIIYILLFFFIIIMFWNKVRTSQLETSTELLGAKKTNLSSENEYEKLRHESNKDVRLYRRTENMLGRLSDDVDEMYALTGDELHQINTMTKLLTKVTAAANQNDQGKVHEYVNMFNRHIASLFTSMKHSEADHRKINSVIEHIDHNISFAFAENHAEEAQFKEILKHHAKGQGKTHSEDELTKLSAQKGIREELSKIRHEASHLQQLKGKLQTEIEKLDDVGYNKKHNAASSARSHLIDGQYKSAHDQLDDLRSYVEKEQHIQREILTFEKEVENAVRDLKNAEKQLRDHLITHYRKNP
jgi:hypothetical protein